jgi:hypothetical protein
MALANSSYALLSLHRAPEAQQRVVQAVAILKDTKDYPAKQIKLDSEIYSVSCAQADYEAQQGDSHRALQMYEQLLAQVTASSSDPVNDLRDAPRMSQLYESLAALYRRNGEGSKAESMQASRLQLWRQWEQKLPNNAFIRPQLDAAAPRLAAIARN